jgi:hypothetical protein
LPNAELPKPVAPKPAARLWRSLAAALVALLALSAEARAETRIFLIDSSDGYGIDACLATGAPCGERIATAWCRAHQYDRAIDFGRVANDAMTPISSGSAGGPSCHGPLCPPVVAITCSR